MALRIEQIPVGMLQVNCYLVWHEENNELLIIDPGAEPDRLIEEINGNNLNPQAILLTHAHVDHIGAVPELSREYSIPVYVHPDDMPLYKSPENALPPWLAAVEDLPDAVSDPPKVIEFDYTVLPTPGHTRGGVSFYFAKARSLFTGDTLFQGSVGRTDLPGGNTKRLMTSIGNELLTLPPDVRIYPGHGNSSTIGHEKKSNPYLLSMNQ